VIVTSMETQLNSVELEIDWLGDGGEKKCLGVGEGFKEI
jgi:hypothetical protein